MLPPPDTIVPTQVTVPFFAYLAVKVKERILPVELGDDAVGSCFVQRPFRSSNSTFATISHILGQENRSILNFLLSRWWERRSPEARGLTEA
jgi:hypothetical protein